MKPAHTRTPAPGTCPGRKFTTPVVVSQVNAVPSLCSTLPTATRIEPATGFALGPARAFERDVEWKQDFVEGHSESPLPTRDCAGDEAGEIDFGTAEAFGIGRCDVDGDVAATCA